MTPSKLILYFFNLFIFGLNATYAAEEYVYGRWPVPKGGLNASCGDIEILGEGSGGRNFPSQSLRRPNAGSKWFCYLGFEDVRVTRLTDPVGSCHDLHWDEDNGSIYYANERFPNIAVHRYVIDSKRHYYVNLASYGCERASTPLPIKDAPGKYFVVCNDNLSTMTWDGRSRRASSFQNVSKPYPNNRWPPYYLKSGKVVRSGALLIYSDPSSSPKTVSESRLLAIINGRTKELAKGFALGTGIGFSLDGRTLYFSDFVENYLYKARYNPRTDSIETVQVLINFSKMKNLGTPNSLTVDSEDYLWVACYKSGLVIKVDPYNGDVICSIRLPVKALTSLTFARCPNADYGSLECLYVASAQTPNGEPSSGSLFLVEGIESVGLSPYWLRSNTIINNRRG